MDDNRGLSRAVVAFGVDSKGMTESQVRAEVRRRVRAMPAEELQAFCHENKIYFVDQPNHQGDSIPPLRRQRRAAQSPPSRENAHLSTWNELFRKTPRT